MKLKPGDVGVSNNSSLLTRGEWIEIQNFIAPEISELRLSSHEESGLKFLDYGGEVFEAWVSPHTRRVD